MSENIIEVIFQFGLDTTQDRIEAQKLQAKFVYLFAQDFPELTITDAYCNLTGAFRQQIQFPAELRNEVCAWIIGRGFYRQQVDESLFDFVKESREGALAIGEILDTARSKYEFSDELI